MSSVYRNGIIILIISSLVFVWDSTTYVLTYTDTPGTFAVQRNEHFVIPAIISVFVIMAVVPIMVYHLSKNHIQKIIFVPLSSIGIFFMFLGILRLIIENRT